MFSKAALKRFNEKVTEGPGPTAYHPSLPQKVSVTSMSKGEASRFGYLKYESTPGPGTYNICKSDSESESNDDVFKTPLALGKKKIIRTSSSSSLGSFLSGKKASALKVVKDDNENLNYQLVEMKKEIGSQTQIITQLKELLCLFKEFTPVLTKELSIDSESYSFIKNAIEKSLRDKSENILELQESKKRLDDQIILLSKNNEALNESLLSLSLKHESLKNCQRNLDAFQIEMEEKNTFLHFTQEQLNNQLETAQEKYLELSKKLAQEKLQHENEIKKFSDKLEDYQETKAKLLAEKFRFIALNNQLTQENETILEDNIRLIGLNNELTISIEDCKMSQETQFLNISHLETLHRELECKIEMMNKDKDLLLQEISRIENEKNNLVYDFSVVSKEKMELDKKLKESCLALKEREKEISDIASELSEYEMKNHSLEGSLSSVSDELSSLKNEIKSLNESNQNLKKEVEEKLKKENDNNNLIERLDKEKEMKKKNERLEEELKSLRTECQALELKIEPFREAMDQYEIDKHFLLSQNAEAVEAVRELAAEHGKTLGHQNHKQKIQILVKLKQDKVELSLKLKKAQDELELYKRKIIANSDSSRLNKELLIAKKQITLLEAKLEEFHHHQQQQQRGRGVTKENKDPFSTECIGKGRESSLSKKSNCLIPSTPPPLQNNNRTWRK